MEGPHWFFLVCPGSTIQNKIALQEWTKKMAKGILSEPSGDTDGFTDDIYCTQQWTLYVSERGEPSSLIE